MIENFKNIRGSLTENAPLAQLTWFKVGGPADLFFVPADEEDLVSFLQQKPKDMPVTLLGLGSNMIIRDGGIRGAVIQLGKNFAHITRQGLELHCGAFATDASIAQAAKKEGLGGLEFLAGIPGTIGGAVPTNAGCYGRELKDILVSLKAIDREGNIHVLTNEQCGFAYRQSQVPESYIVTSVILKAHEENPDTIAGTIKDIQEKRKDTQPITYRTGGSTFANPEGHSAWKLIDEAGCRGLTMGGAMVSDKHTNFLINTGTATAADIENLGEEVRRRVKEKTGIDLHWEIKRLGERI